MFFFAKKHFPTQNLLPHAKSTSRCNIFTSLIISDNPF